MWRAGRVEAAPAARRVNTAGALGRRPAPGRARRGWRRRGQLQRAERAGSVSTAAPARPTPTGLGGGGAETAAAAAAGAARECPLPPRAVAVADASSEVTHLRACKAVGMPG